MRRGSCYIDECGPCVKTGFHISQYWVCTRCKQEITEALAQSINDRRDWEEKQKKLSDTGTAITLDTTGHYETFQTIQLDLFIP